MKENRAYLDDHPEVTQLLNDYISAALAEQPDDVFDFARQYFKGTSNPGEEPNPEPARVQTEADGEQDDLDDLVESSNSSQLRQYLKKVFDETDVDGNGELSKSELKAKLAVSPCPCSTTHALIQSVCAEISILTFCHVLVACPRRMMRSRSCLRPLAVRDRSACSSS